jgi:hypothetical protein
MAIAEVSCPFLVWSMGKSEIAELPRWVGGPVVRPLHNLLHITETVNPVFSSTYKTNQIETVLFILLGRAQKGAGYAGQGEGLCSKRPLAAESRESHPTRQLVWAIGYWRRTRESDGK